MGADRADFRSLRADDDVPAVAALPDFDFALFEDLLGFHILQEGAVTLFMVLLDGRNTAELLRQLGEACCRCR